MVKDRVCVGCGVEISEDLSNCPLCGRHVGRNGAKCKETPNSYPFYSLKAIQTLKWYNIINVLFWIAAIVCVVVNLVFKTDIYWFPYVLAGLVMIFNVFIEPVKVNGASYIKNLTIISVLLAIFVVFIDAYNHYSFKIEFGWALAYAAPLLMFAATVVSTTICLTSKIYESELLRRISFLAFLSIVYFTVKNIWYKSLATWPSLVFMCTAIGSVALLELFKRNKLIKELGKEFHI